MFRIGDFAKMARISIKTLHHYDEIDLFKPELVHAATGYRSYRIDIEMAVEVEGSLLTKAAHFPSDHVRVWELPGTPTMAYLLLSGSYDRLWDAHIRLMIWIEDTAIAVLAPLAVSTCAGPPCTGNCSLNCKFPSNLDIETGNTCSPCAARRRRYAS